MIIVSDPDPVEPQAMQAESVASSTPYTQVMFDRTQARYWGNGMYGTYAWLARCESCGALVGDQPSHNAFHDSVTALQTAVTALQTEVAALQTPPTGGAT